jgi:hypothetical protein
LTSLIVVPEIYDINAGSIGRMHGDTKEATPANAETTTLLSTIIYAFDVIALMAMSTLYQHLNELETSGMIARTKVESFRGKPIRFYYTISVRGKRAVVKE